MFCSLFCSYSPKCFGSVPTHSRLSGSIVEWINRGVNQGYESTLFTSAKIVFAKQKYDDIIPDFKPFTVSLVLRVKTQWALPCGGPSSLPPLPIPDCSSQTGFQPGSSPWSPCHQSCAPCCSLCLKVLLFLFSYQFTVSPSLHTSWRVTPLWPSLSVLVTSPQQHRVALLPDGTAYRWVPRAVCLPAPRLSYPPSAS